MTDLEELVVQAQAGDQQAFASLYDQFAPLIRSLGYDASGSLAEAEDLCQEIFLQAYRKLGQLRDPARFPGWLVSIARRAGVEWHRHRGQRPQVGLDGIELPGKPVESFQEETERMLAALRQLPEKERMALHLVYLTEQPASVARQILGLSSAGFYKLLGRAKKRLAAILQPGKVVR